MRKLILLVVFAGSLYGQADEQITGTMSLSLEEAQKYALSNSYQVVDKQLEIDKAKQTIRKTASVYLPKVSAQYAVTHNPIIQPFAIPNDPESPFYNPASTAEFSYLAFGASYQNQAVISANWFIGDLSNILATKASRALKEIRQLEKEDVELTVKADVAKAYYQVLVATESERIVRENLKSLQDNLTEVRELYNNGFSEEQDVQQLELLVSGLENNLNNVGRQIVLSKQLLKFHMGMPMEKEVLLTGTLDSYKDEAIGSAASFYNDNINISDNITQRSIDAQYRASVLQYKNEWYKNFPTLSFTANYSNTYFSNDFDPVNFNTYWAPGASIVGTLKWDLFTGLSRQSTINTAKLDIERAKVAQEATESQVELEFEQARSNYEYALDNYNNQLRNVDLSKSIRNKTRIKYKEGISSSLELTQAENQYLESQQNYLTALQNLLNAKEEILLAIGK
jgi:outer membrane protein TolC